MEGMEGRGDLEGAYAAGKHLEGGASEVLGEWLEEVATQLAFEKVLRELELHIRREEMWRVCWSNGCVNDGNLGESLGCSPYKFATILVE